MATRILSNRLLPVIGTSLVLSISLVSQAQAAPAADFPSVTRTYNQWVTILENSDCDGSDMASLYTKQAILLATFKTYVQGRAEITEYFDHLSCKDSLTVSTQKITTASVGAMAYATGLYTFSYKNADGSTTKVPARFTFVYEKKDGKWMVANHHSSKDPETSKDPVAATP